MKLMMARNMVPLLPTLHPAICSAMGAEALSTNLLMLKDRLKDDFGS